ncbi:MULTISPECIES: glycosyltransferase [unclassified Sphingomonas]|uniref:glycosyltransferase n=1 Tax=unclassified Sphingomonas TaxID=196159 RepID=UPI00092B5C81|nr:MULTISPECIES: glycosyltransferase [unclassified Sphingomonas]MBN8847612.1 glycosyltransferase [Sphingomonas sp.]OJV31527.1 MAG: polysaccharide deacetylase [Sphingomonas sp. 67-36]
MNTPIFYDPSGRRGTRARRSVAVLIALIVLVAIAFASTLVAVPSGPDLPLPFAHRQAERFNPHATPTTRSASRWLPHLARTPKAAKGTAGKPVTIGFYVSGNDGSIASLQRHINSLDWVVPAVLTTDASGNVIQSRAPRLAQVMAAAARPPKLLPMVQNIVNAQWDGKGAATMLRDRAHRKAAIQRLVAFVADQHAAGLVMDYENLPPEVLPAYVSFLAQLNKALPESATLAVTVPAGEPEWRLASFARVVDNVILMAYDEHWQSGKAGPIASQPWFVQVVEDALRQVGHDKLIVALGSYGYDWHDDSADAMSVGEAWLAARNADTPVTFDPASGNAGYAYNQDGTQHQIWMLDAATSWNQFVALRRLGIVNIAMWRIGTEDPGFWNALAAFRTKLPNKVPVLDKLKADLDVDVEGSGEILRITASPTDGQRRVAYDKDAMIRREEYVSLPTPYVVQRAGAVPKKIALTFDDGPDATWTPKILDILEREHVPGTFFVIGENALQHPQLLRRIVADGSEIGNHTYTHPNLALSGERTVDLELNTTQRLVQAYTGRSMTLFRAPYFGDAEPTTADEIGPALIAQQHGYTVVGLHVDPNDWQRPGTQTIIREVLSQVDAVSPDRSANVVLLHDGGGNREQTVEALPQVIAGLRARGYSFVTASQLVGLPQSVAMPEVKGRDLLAVRTDVGIFIALALLSIALSWLFYVAIVLGIARAVLMAGLAWLQTGRRRAVPPDFHPSVSVIIPAYNEERVIVASVRRVLASDYPGIEVIVADDGSKDRTSALVAEAFADDPRVTLMTLTNGGKAAALNRALAQAHSEVVIALDADTQFEPETIARLTRWFADPAIGAVAGDARVGNRVNLVTRWQAIEYITAQNLERRALAGFDAMTVVPGAVGAWRRTALESVGGYPENTLAEDQDLTIAIQRAGWRVSYDPRAVAWTEAPETFRALAKQRYRWAFGTLQCLWKHRGVIASGKPTGLAHIGLPQAWLFQIAFAAISPLIDLALILSIGGTIMRVQQHGWAQTSGDVGKMGIYWLCFTAIDVLCGWIAYRLDGRKVRYPAFLLVAQRLVYRQIMYWVVLRAISSAIGGWVVGWGKLERSGRVQAA